MQVFQIAYCDIFKASSADSCRNVCQAFVDSAKRHMPTLLDKQKTHLLLHLVDCMVQFGPSSAFSAERYIEGVMKSVEINLFTDLSRLMPMFGHITYLATDWLLVET